MSPPRALWLSVGIDIGQKHDPTTICVAELDERQDEQWAETHYLVRHLERLPLGLPYPELVRILAQRLRAVAERCNRGQVPPRVLVDATGVGQPVFDQLVALRLGVQLVRVTLTSGQTHDLQPGSEFPTLRLGKAAFTSRLQALVQGHRLHLPKNPEGRALAQELRDFEIRVGTNGNDRYGAFRSGTHDDLVIAVGLAAQTDLGDFLEGAP